VAPAGSTGAPGGPFGGFEDVIQSRRREADEFYASVIPSSLGPDAANVMRQALAGMLWSKQFYYYDVEKWLEERGVNPFKSRRRAAPRNEHWHHMYQVAEELARRLASVFLRDKNGRRPVYGEARKFQEDWHWRDLILFYECFHGDNGAGLGASHQTGWTGIIARTMHLFATSRAEQFLELGKVAGITEVKPARSGQPQSPPTSRRR
jgi:hypothetical protein